MGLISRVSSRTYRRLKKWLPTSPSRSKRSSPGSRSRTGLCPNGSGSRPPRTRSGTTPRGGTGREPSSASKLGDVDPVHRHDLFAILKEVRRPGNLPRDYQLKKFLQLQLLFCRFFRLKLN